MDRLVKPNVKELNLTFIKDQKCSTTFTLTNLMHTMSVAVSLTTTNPSFSFSQSLSILPPLSNSTFTLLLSNPFPHPPLSTPLDTVLVKSSMLPTGKASQDDLLRLFSKPGPTIFKDAIIPISFIGPHVIEFLLSSPTPKKLDIPFLLSKAIPSCTQSHLTSLLISAAKTGNCLFISALISAGADVNYRDSTGTSVMSYAIQSGNVDAVNVLIECGYSLDNKIDLFLHEAARMNRVELMEVLCLSYLDLDVNLSDVRGRTPLHVAASNGNVDAMRFLISVGSDQNMVDYDGWTSLHFAASQGHVEVVDFLLNCSMFIKYAVTKEGKTAFGLAVENEHSDLYEMLHLGDVLLRSARIDDVNGIKSCLAEGGNVNCRDQNGWTPLHRAAFKGRIESVKVLLGHGAQVDLVDDCGCTPLHRAVEAGHVEVALWLLGNGAKANVKSLLGVVPWNLDSFKNHPSLVSPMCHERERA